MGYKKVYRLVAIVPNLTKLNNNDEPVREWKSIGLFSEKDKLDAYLDAKFVKEGEFEYDVQEYQLGEDSLKGKTYDHEVVDPVYESN